MFSRVSVILFTGTVFIPACTGADTPPEQTPQRADTPHPADPPGHTYPSMHWCRPPQADADTPSGRTPPGRPPPTATAADGMHPTGMLSCYCLQMKCMLGDTGNKRMVRILLECILVETIYTCGCNTSNFL